MRESDWSSDVCSSDLGLGGMLMSTVTGIDHGDQGFLCGYHGSAFLGMAHIFYHFAFYLLAF